jgi:hypothetical protein
MPLEKGLALYLINGLKATYPNLQVFGVVTPVDFISKTNSSSGDKCRYGISYRCIIDKPSPTLEGEDSLSFAEYQLDCNGYEMKDAIKLAQAVQDYLAGAFSGQLPDGTVVDRITRLPGKVDGITEQRTFIRSLEYQIIYHAS